MKKIVFIILLTLSMNCLAISQKLIDGAENYEVALENSQRITRDLNIANSSYQYWMKLLTDANNNPRETDSMRKIYQNEVDESSKSFNELNTKYMVAQNTLKKYESIKNEYDTQIAWEHKMNDIKDAVLSGIVMTLFFSIFVLLFWYAYRQNRKYKQLLKEGKITKEEYDRLVKAMMSEPSMFNDRFNPATGLRMIGGCDVGGNPYGSSGSTTSFNTQSCSSRHRWD